MLFRSAIGDCDESEFTYSELSDALALLNEEFVDCKTVATGCLVLPGAATAPVAPQGAQSSNEGSNEQKPALISEVPKETQLLQNHPNPFNPTTTISFVLRDQVRVKLAIYDVAGRQVRELVNETMPSGAHSVEWDGRTSQGVAAASGVYFYRMQAGDFVQTKRMVMLK